jgi:TolA-binding protein
LSWCTDSVETRLAEAKDNLALLKSQLVSAKLARERKMQYDDLAKKIRQLPSRDESLEQIIQINQDITHHEKDEQLHEVRLANRRHLFVPIIKAQVEATRQLETADDLQQLASIDEGGVVDSDEDSVHELQLADLEEEEGIILE